jgi:tetratricopeptide (TPR) repeat protein
VFWICFIIAVLSLPGSLYLIYEKTFLTNEKRTATKADIREVDLRNIDYLEAINRRSADEEDLGEELFAVFNDKTDSIKSIVNRALESEFSYRYDQAIAEWRKILSFERIGSDGHSSAWLMIARLNRYKGNKLDALEASVLSNIYAKEIDSIDSLYFLEFSSNYVGLAYLDINEYEKAISSHKSGIEYAKAYGDTMSIAQNSGNIANIYISIDSLRLAREYLKEALDNYKIINDKRGQALQYSNLGSIFFKENEIDSALSYHLNALSLFNEIGFKKNVISLTAQIGIDYFEMGDTFTAETLLQRAYLESENINIPSEHSILLLNYGGFYYRINDFENAAYYYEKAIPLLIQLNEIEKIIYSLYFIAMSKYKNDDYTSALFHATKGIEYCNEYAPTNEYLKKLYMIKKICYDKGGPQ